MAERDLKLELEAALPELGKAVFSQPIDRTADSRLTVRHCVLFNNCVFNIATSDS